MSNYNTKMVICVRKDLKMRKGKIAAQVAHASMQFLLNKGNLQRENLVANFEVDHLTEAEFEWFHSGYAKIVVSCDSKEELVELIAEAQQQNIQVCPIVDHGYTEFHGVKTLTCAAFGPAHSEELNKLTGHLKLL